MRFRQLPAMSPADEAIKKRKCRALKSACSSIERELFGRRAQPVIAGSLAGSFCMLSFFHVRENLTPAGDFIHCWRRPYEIVACTSFGRWMLFPFVVAGWSLAKRSPEQLSVPRIASN